MKKTVTGAAIRRAALCAALWAAPILCRCGNLTPPPGPAAPPEPSAGLGAAGLYQDGVYRGAGTGYRGTILVEVRVEDGAVAEIRIIDHGDDEYVGGAAMEELLDMALAYHTTDLDAVSGATESSAGFLAALDAALAQAAVSGAESRPRDSAGTGREK
jgi:uncharacterized protein with FMN-binding domain